MNKDMVRCELVPSPVDTLLVYVDSEPVCRGTLVIAEDRRREYIIVSQSARGVGRLCVCRRPGSKIDLFRQMRYAKAEDPSGPV